MSSFSRRRTSPSALPLWQIPTAGAFASTSCVALNYQLTLLWRHFLLLGHSRLADRPWTMAVDMESSSASQTLELLEARLKRVAYVLGGHQPERIAQAGTSATQRLKELERALDHIIQRSKVSQDLMKLCKSTSLYRNADLMIKMRAILNYSNNTQHQAIFQHKKSRQSFRSFLPLPLHIHAPHQA